MGSLGKVISETAHFCNKIGAFPTNPFEKYKLSVIII